MTKRDYEKIANVINRSMKGLKSDSAEAYLRGFHNGKWNLANDIADMLEDDNPRFDRDKFLRACGL